MSCVLMRLSAEWAMLKAKPSISSGIYVTSAEVVVWFYFLSLSAAGKLFLCSSCRHNILRFMPVGSSLRIVFSAPVTLLSPV